jgi:hypothetical protein
MNTRNLKIAALATSIFLALTSFVLLDEVGPGLNDSEKHSISLNPMEEDGDNDASSAPAPAVKSLASQVNYSALTAAFTGMAEYEGVKTDRLIIIDFSLPSTEERFFLVNPKTGELLYKKHVAHGQNSGGLYAKYFSNKNGSHQSSLGFYKTAETYYGKHGYSLRLDGLQKGINHTARTRAIVIHQADYVSSDFIAENGRLGRSWGCPALPADDYEKIINEVKGGTLVFIYHPSLKS